MGVRGVINLPRSVIRGAQARSRRRLFTGQAMLSVRVHVNVTLRPPAKGWVRPVIGCPPLGVVGPLPRVAGALPADVMLSVDRDLSREGERCGCRRMARLRENYGAPRARVQLAVKGAR